MSEAVSIPKDDLSNTKSGVSYLKETQLLPVDTMEAWEFFSDPRNLRLITPPELDFKILTESLAKEVYEGMLIDYKVKPLLGIALNWKTQITKVDKPCLFQDKQINGPYKFWEHTHVFIRTSKGTLMEDHVLYQLPFGFIGKMAEKWFVRKKIEHIFQYRRCVIHKHFDV